MKYGSSKSAKIVLSKSMIEQLCFLEFSGNQGKHQNLDTSILPYKFGLIFIGMKQKKFFFSKKNSKWPIQKKLIFQNRQFSKNFRENFSDLSLG